MCAWPLEIVPSYSRIVKQRKQAGSTSLATVADSVMHHAILACFRQGDRTNHLKRKEDVYYTSRRPDCSIQGENGDKMKTKRSRGQVRGF